MTDGLRPERTVPASTKMQATRGGINRCLHPDSLENPADPPEPTRDRGVKGSRVRCVAV